MTEQNRPIAEMKNMGPKSSLWLAEIGIHTESDLRQRGIIDAYIAVKGNNPRTVNLMMLWALQGALMDINCLHLPDEIKAALKQDLIKHE
nr:TfoX/Sxy family protein [uncultured Cohaesibacter sp.]